MSLKLVYITTLLLLFTFVNIGFGQEIRTNSEGEKIIVYPDGRMEYFNGEPVPLDTLTANSGEQLYPVFTGYIEPLDGAVQPNEADLFKIAQRRAQLSTSAAEIAQNRLQQAQENLKENEKRLAHTSPGDSAYATLLKQTEAAQATFQQSMREAQEANRLASSTEELINKGGFIEAFNARQRAYQDAENISRNLRQAADQNYTAILPLAENFVVSSNKNLLHFPPTRTCSFAYEGTDESYNAYRRDTESELLFTYTDERLRPYLKEKEYLYCKAHLTSLRGFRYLTLEFTFAYPNAREAYGFIDRNSVLTIKLLNGDFVNLRAGELARGQYNTAKQELHYEVRYPIDRSLIATLKNSELDLVRVWWSSGYEEYPIQQLDFFQHALHCLGD